MEVLNSEIAWNGSISGGVTDVNDAVTSYRNCIVHDNAGAAFSFTGKAHRVYDSLIFNQETAFHVHKEVDFKKSETKLNNDEIAIMAMYFHTSECSLTYWCR